MSYPGPNELLSLVNNSVARTKEFHNDQLISQPVLRLRASKFRSQFKPLLNPTQPFHFRNQVRDFNQIDWPFLSIPKIKKKEKVQQQLNKSLEQGLNLSGSQQQGYSTTYSTPSLFKSSAKDSPPRIFNYNSQTNNQSISAKIAQST